MRLPYRFVRVALTRAVIDRDLTRLKKLLSKTEKLRGRERRGNKNNCVWVKWQAKVNSFCTNFLVRELYLVVTHG